MCSRAHDTDRAVFCFALDPKRVIKCKTWYVQFIWRGKIVVIIEPCKTHAAVQRRNDTVDMALQFEAQNLVR